MGEDRRSSDDVRLPVDLPDVAADVADDLHRVLASESRRLVLSVLLDDPGNAYDLDELARILTGVEAVETGRMRTPEDFERMRISLHHRDLPMLDETGFASYDPEASTVALAGLDDDLERTVRRVVEPTRSVTD